jgi:RND family efflux transporter MFP subunit
MLISPAHRKRFAFGAALLLPAVALVLWRVLATSQAASPPAGPPEVPVAVATVELQDVPHLASGVGSVQSLNSVLLRPQVSGVVTEVLFEEGQRVERGVLLARIDDRSIVASLRQAEAEKARNEAQLKAARLDLSRYGNLLAEEAISRQTVEQQTAVVEQLEAAIRANEATIAAQQVQLSYTRIAAPVTGRVGMRHVDPGNLVQAGDATGLVTVTQIDPISIVFTMPQELLSSIQSQMQGAGAAGVTAYDRYGGAVLAQGKLKTIDNQIDAATGTIRLRAEFANRDGKLWPGQFVAVQLQTGMSPRALVVPAKAVQQGLQGPFVYRVREQRAEVVRVSVAYSNDDIAAISSGPAASSAIADGDSVVVDGHSRLKPDARVKLVSPAEVATVAATPRSGSALR